jgi:hypothetical protein
VCSVRSVALLRAAQVNSRRNKIRLLSDAKDGDFSPLPAKVCKHG